MSVQNGNITKKRVYWSWRVDQSKKHISSMSLWPRAIENLSIPLKMKITAYTTGTGVTCNVIKPVDKWCVYHSLYYQIECSNL